MVTKANEKRIHLNYFKFRMRLNGLCEIHIFRKARKAWRSFLRWSFATLSILSIVWLDILNRIVSMCDIGGDAKDARLRSTRTRSWIDASLCLVCNYISHLFYYRMSQKKKKKKPNRSCFVFIIVDLNSEQPQVLASYSVSDAGLIVFIEWELFFFLNQSNNSFYFFFFSCNLLSLYEICNRFVFRLEVTFKKHN